MKQVKSKSPKKPEPKKDPNGKTNLVNFKASDRECARMKANAKKYTNGVVSEWLRLVGADARFLKTDRVRVRKLAA